MPIAPPSDPPPAAAPTAKPRKLFWSILWAGLVMLALGGFGGWLYARNTMIDPNNLPEIVRGHMPARSGRMAATPAPSPSPKASPVAAARPPEKDDAADAGDADADEQDDAYLAAIAALKTKPKY